MNQSINSSTSVNTVQMSRNEARQSRYLMAKLSGLVREFESATSVRRPGDDTLWFAACALRGALNMIAASESMTRSLFAMFDKTSERPSSLAFVLIREGAAIGGAK